MAFKKSTKVYIKKIDLHAFRGDSKDGVSATVCPIVHQSNGKSQGLLCSKSQLSKQGLTIPRLELVACHMPVNLLETTKKALTDYSIDKLLVWTDISNMLHWIWGNGNYKQFVKTAADKICEKKEITRPCINTTKIPADRMSCGMSVANMGELSWKWPGWTGNSDNWPSDIKTKATAEKEKEARIIKDLMTSTTLKSDDIDEILQRYTYWKFLIIASWIQRFLNNSKKLKSKIQSESLTTKEIESSKILWMKTIQTKTQDTPKFKDDAEKMNIQLARPAGPPFTRVVLQVTTQSTFHQIHRWARNCLHMLT